MQKRRQLTLFFDKEELGEIAKIRKKYNPVQAALIASHITLCREDEIEKWEVVRQNIEQLRFPAFSIELGKLIRFSAGKGLLIGVEKGHEKFQALREKILQGTAKEIRAHQAHLTLMHPRNSSCTEELYEEISQRVLPQTLMIREISLIEQVLGEKWHTLQSFLLHSDQNP